MADTPRRSSHPEGNAGSSVSSKKVASIVRIDYWNIRDREKAARTPVLEVIMRELIRGEVIGQYTLIDDLLSTEVCLIFFAGQGFDQAMEDKEVSPFQLLRNRAALHDAEARVLERCL